MQERPGCMVAHIIISHCLPSARHSFHYFLIGEKCNMNPTPIFPKGKLPSSSHHISISITSCSPPSHYRYHYQSLLPRRVDVWTCGRVDVWTCGRVVHMCNLCVCVYVCVYLHTQTHTHTHTHTCKHTYITCVCVYIYIYLYIYAIYIYKI